MQHAKKAGYHTLQIPDYGQFDCQAVTRWVADRMLLHGLDTLVMIAYPLHDIGYIRSNVPGAHIIFHFHGAPLWEVAERLESGRAAAKATGSRTKYCKWYLLKYAKERLLHVYTRRFSRRYRMIYREVDTFVTLCDGYRAKVRKISKAARNDTKVKVMYNPLDTETLAQAAATPKRQEVLFVGRLSQADKRVDRLLRIWSMVEPKHPDWTLKIVGDGPDRQNLEQQARELGLRNIVFAGYCPTPSQHYATASILCLTSSTEGWGLVLVEAQASGVVPMAFAVSDGVKEILGDSEFGIAVKPFDEESLCPTAGRAHVGFRPARGHKPTRSRQLPQILPGHRRHPLAPVLQRSIKTDIMPRLSIITINRNNAAGLEATLDSVWNRQPSFADFEHIVIDGASTDGSTMSSAGMPTGWHTTCRSPTAASTTP